MKKIIVFSSFLISTIFSNAQPTLTSSNIHPIVGEVFTVASSNSSVSPGNSGPNQNWNLSNFGSTSSTTYSFVATSSVPSASLFSAANIARASVNNEFNFYNNTNSISTFEGFISNTASGIYSNPETMLSLPTNYNDSFSDSWVTNFKIGTLNITRTGVSAYTADSWGTLTTPSGTYNNVLRMKIVSTYTDSGSGSSQGSQTTYKWFKPNTHYEIAQTTTITINGGGSVYSSSYLMNTITNINSNNDHVLEMILFPNPSNGEINFSLITPEISALEIKILDITSKTISTFSNLSSNSGRNEFKLDVKDLNSGVYFANVYLNGSLYKCEKFIITH